MDALSIGSIKLNFDGCSSGNPGQLGIGGTLTDHYGTLMRAFSNNVVTTIEVEIIVLLEGLKLAKAEGLSNLLVDRDFAVVLRRDDHRGLMDGYAKFFYITLVLGCSSCWIPWAANHMVDMLAKQGAIQLISFVGDFLNPPPKAFELVPVKIFRYAFPTIYRVDSCFSLFIRIM